MGPQRVQAFLGQDQWVNLQWANVVLIYGMGHRSMGGVMCYRLSHGWGLLILGHSLWESQRWGHPCDDGIAQSEKDRK